jgi:hypothetical protein
VGRRERKKASTWRVWIEQVNQTYVDVKAATRAEAEEKATKAWRRGWADARVLDAKDLDVS